MADVPSTPIRFPPRPVKPAVPALALPRRHSTRSPFELTAASAEARKQIADIMSATRAPFAKGAAAVVSSDQVEALQRSLRELEARLAEREHAVKEAETNIAERDRDLAEAEALIAARQKLVDASRHSGPESVAVITPEEKDALQLLKAELDRQEELIREQKAELVERERFMQENEAKLFEKMMQQQETETELEQKFEDLAVREKLLRQREAKLDPGTTPPVVEPALKKFDEFNE